MMMTAVWRALASLALLVAIGDAWRTRFHNPNCADNRVAMVHLFEWKWTDIASECERFLAPMGYCGVQVSPPNEHVVVDNQPWWQRYQPVSYKLESRSGNRDQFIDMVTRCNNVGVRIYVDAIINHMAGGGRKGRGSGGTEFDADELDFPGVPYTSADFNGCDGCPACCCVNSWTDLVNVRNCRLLGLTDLNQGLQQVRQKIVGFFDDLIDIGVAGFRIDAGKHMWPDDLKAIAEMTKDLPTRWFAPGSKAFFFHEVIDLSQIGEVRAQEYTKAGMVTEFRYCIKIGEVAGGLWGIDGLHDAGWGMLDSEDAFVFVDNHDNQRGHGGGGNVVTFKDPRKYKVAQAVTLGYTYGHPRIMSSYRFNGGDDGPPHNDDFSTKDVTINADGSCGNGWVCEHRWQAIAGMASFRKAVNWHHIENKRTEGNRVAFSRGGRGFVAISNDGNWAGRFQTGMPAGQYCNVIKGCPNNHGGCDGADPVTVHGDGSVDMSIDDWDNPIFAIHVEARAGSGSCSGGGQVEPQTPPPPTHSPPTLSPPTENPNPQWMRTVVLINKGTQPGQDLFLRGGIDHGRGRNCGGNADTDPCSVSIRTRSLGDGQHYSSYNNWRQGCTRLNWYGPQAGQGRHNGAEAEGAPAAWTTDRSGQAGYQELNKYGEHYWMIDMEVDCSQADQGWIDLKAFVRNGEGWEGRISQGECGGTAGGRAPFQSENHLARCGFINVFQWGSPNCEVNNF